MEATIRRAAEEAAIEVRDIVFAAALQAAVEAVREAVRRELGVELPEEVIDLEERVTRTEAARRLGTTSQTIIRLEEKGLVGNGEGGGARLRPPRRGARRLGRSQYPGSHPGSASRNVGSKDPTPP